MNKQFIPALFCICFSITLVTVFALNNGPAEINMKTTFKVEGSKEAVIFPHHEHQNNLDCSNCHLDIEKNSDLKIKLTKFNGYSNDFHKKFCWPCHEKLEVPQGKKCSTCHVKQASKPDVDTKSYPSSNTEPAQNSNFYPYSPSLLKWNKSSADFNAPRKCAECHPEKFKEWSGSMHALAFVDPVYQGELNAAVKAMGPVNSVLCEGCHSPAAVVKGEIHGAGLSGLTPLAKAGVSCDVCHSVSGHTHWQTPYHQPQNGSLVLSPGENTSEGMILTKYGPKQADQECGGDFHKCIQSPLHLNSELCASCHQIFHYKTNTPLEATYTEWKNGPYSANNIHCQDCHMVDTQTFKRSADTLIRPALSEYHHYFNGANFLLYYLDRLAAEKSGENETAGIATHKYDMAVARLKAAAELDVRPIYRNNTLSELKVRVKNIRAGHNLPTSLTTIRQMWLELTVRDENAVVLMSTGTVDAGAPLSENTRVFNSTGQDNEFNFAIDPWKITSFSRHETIPPRGYRDVYFGVPVVQSKTVTVDVKLRYRQADQKVAEKLLGLVPDDIKLDEIYGLKEIPALPIIDMVQMNSSFKVTDKNTEGI